MSELNDQKASDPFAPDNAQAWSLVMQMRIYDVLMALLDHFDSKTADLVYETHQRGGIVSDPPSFNFQPKDTDA